MLCLDLPGSSRFRAVVNFQSKGELVVSGNFGNQNTLVANTQRSFRLKLADFLGTKVWHFNS